MGDVYTVFSMIALLIVICSSYMAITREGVLSQSGVHTMLLLAAACLIAADAWFSFIPATSKGSGLAQGSATLTGIRLSGLWGGSTSAVGKLASGSPFSAWDVVKTTEEQTVTSPGDMWVVGAFTFVVFPAIVLVGASVSRFAPDDVRIRSCRINTILTSSAIIFWGFMSAVALFHALDHVSTRDVVTSGT